MSDSCPNYFDAPSHKPLAYLPEFGLLAQFGHPSRGDRLNYPSSESRRTGAAGPKSERQTATLDQKLSSLELHAGIAHEQCRS
jgi:hypothetical protein